jgi:hypothetical protein
MVHKSSRSRRPLWPLGLAAGAVLAGAAVIAPTTEAHKAITSPYNYNEHVFPILRQRCAGCHYEGGPTPMSLMAYRDALPWAESIREQLVGEKMPPWHADPTGPAVRGGHSITTRELDVLITWAIGGTPQGSANTDPQAFVAPKEEWKAGPPDHQVAMESEHTLKPGDTEEEREFVLSTGLKEEKWVKAVDLLPGVRTMVRDAVVSVDNGPVLAAWVPGHEALSPPSGTAFKLPPNATLRLKIHYKKHWMDEQKSVSDKTTIGLYFTDAPLSGKSVQSITIDGPGEAPGTHDPVKFSGGAFETGARVVGFRPSFDQAYASVKVEGVLPDKRRVTLLKLRAAQAQWYRRYWLTEPFELPKGTKVEVTATPAPEDEFAPPVPKRYPLQVGVDYVAQ